MRPRSPLFAGVRAVREMAARGSEGAILPHRGEDASRPKSWTTTLPYAASYAPTAR